MAVLPKAEKVPLDYPIQLADRKLAEVTMRRPTMRDIREHPVLGPHDVAGEMGLFAALTNTRVEEIEGMDSADYARLQDLYTRFRTPTERRTDPGDGAGALPADAVATE